MTDRAWSKTWTEGAGATAYGDLFFQRATGALPEMESSKAAARRLAGLLRPGDRLLDVGCGAGHYYRSIKERVSVPLSYTGLDATPYYVERAREAYRDDAAASFVVGDVFAIDFPERSFDVVMCNNVLLHLPSIARPLSELCRVARRRLMIRTLIGAKSYVVMDVAPGEDGADFDVDGKPVGFHYLNIYGEPYVRRLLAAEKRVRGVTLEPDREFIAENLDDTRRALPGAWDATGVAGGIQVSGPIMLPWQWLTIELAEA
jgi:SAM-dependent methyltransferase